MATFIVTNTNDSGDGSLRAAVEAANANAGADVIVFAASFDGEAADVIRLTSGQITITDADGLTIDGGAGVTITGDALGDDTVVDGVTVLALTGAEQLDDNTRIFDATAGDLTLEGLTLTGGRTNGDSAPGGAVRAAKALTISDTKISGNSTAGANSNGGGVYSNGYSGGYGGYSDGIVSIINSEISDNETQGASYGGGGIASTLNISLINSTISGNKTLTGTGGGALGFYDVDIVNSTLSGNVAGRGGGVFVVYGGLYLTSSTITGNSASGDGGGISGGRGLFGLGFVSITDSILLGNVSGSGTAGYFERPNPGNGFSFGVASFGDNILADSAGGADVFSGETIVGQTTAAEVFAETRAVNASVVAGVLADNGGPVRTVALKADAANPALDAATGGSVTADARGVAAVDLSGVGASGSGAAVRDLGAFEVEGIPDAPSLVVTTAADVVNAFDGVTSLREAAAFAQTLTTASTITFDLDPGERTITLTRGQIALNGLTLTIDGDLDDDGVADITIDANGDGDGDAATSVAQGAAAADPAAEARAFRLTSDGLPAAFTLDGLILTGGAAGAGGAVQIDRGPTDDLSVVILNSRFENNAARTTGGAVEVMQGSLRVEDSTFVGNTSGRAGGAVAVTASISAGDTLSIQRSAFEDNRAAAGDGGGLYVNASQSTVTVEDSSFLGNSARSGGAISTLAVDQATLVNVTIAGNEAALYGGGLSTRNGTIEITNSTITGNAASFGGALFAEAGGTTRFTNSVVAGNASTGSGAQVYSYSPTLTSGGGNAFGDAASALSFEAASDLTGQSAASLFRDTAPVGSSGVTGGVAADNGGPVPTVALSDSSAARNLGLAGGPAADARGVTRDAAPDAGAYEDPLTPETPSLVVTTAADVVDAFDSLTSLREAVAFANATEGADTVSFDAGVTFIRLTQGEIAITDADGLTIDGGAGVTITGDALGNDTVVDGVTVLAQTAETALGDNSRIFQATEGALTLDGLTLTGGRTTAETAFGGAVSARGDLTLVDVTVSGNSTTGRDADGGGVASRGTLTITNSTVSGNVTAGEVADGGGAFGFGLVEITDSVVAGNLTTARNADGGGLASNGAVTLTRAAVMDNRTLGHDADGGGMAVRNNLTLVDTTISGNSTQGDDADGGGLLVVDNALITNSTIFGNSTAGTGAEGGGVLARGGISTNAPKSITFVNSTVTGNSTAGANSEGGGVNGRLAVTLTDSIVLGNVTASAGVAGDEVSAGTLTRTGGNIVGDGAGGADVFSGAADVGDTSAAAVFAATVTIAGGVVAGALADNGGPVRTIALKADVANPALDASTGGSVTADARGEAAVDFPGAGASGSGAAVRDLGAFEVDDLPIVNAAPTLDPIQDISILEGTTAGFAISASDLDGDAITLSVAVTRDSTGATISPSEYTFTDNGDGTGDFAWATDSADDGAYTVTVTASDGEDSATETLALVVQDVPVSTTNTLLVRAGGNGTPVAPPRFEVFADGVLLGERAILSPVASGSFNVNNDALYQDYSFAFAGPSPDKVEIRYFNDGTTGGINRNLFVDYIDLNGERFESEIAGFFNPLNPQSPFSGLRETLWVNGTLAFDDLPDTGGGVRNTPPSLAAIEDITITEGATVTFAVSASDLDGDAIALSVAVTRDSTGGVVSPSEYVFTDNGNGTGNFVWATDANDEGAYTIAVTASDGEDTATESLALVVGDAPATGSATLVVRAGGTGTSAIAPRFEVLADGVSLGLRTITAPAPSFNVNNDSLFQDYEFSLADDDVENVTIRFLNDGKSGAIDRNLYVDFIEIDDRIFESEVDGFFFPNSNNAQLAGARETLFVNGALVFDDLLI